MSQLAFLRPGVLWVVPIIILALVVWRFRRRRRFLAFNWVSRLGHLRPRPSVVRRLPAMLVVLALALIVVALTEPVIPYSESEITAQGLDIVIVLDLSSSMQNVMGTPIFGAPIDATAEQKARAERLRLSRTRLETTKRALLDFISSRRDDRLGLIVFSNQAYLVSPLTFDHNALTDYVDMVDLEILRGEGMTAIGDGITLANGLLERQSTDKRENKVILVFTDGEHNFGRDPIDALHDSAQARFRVHLIGLDLEEQVQLKPAVQELIATVRRDGGQYFAANNAQQLRAVNIALASLEKGSLRGTSIVRNVPVFDWFAIPAIIFLLAGLSLRVVPYFADFT